MEKFESAIKTYDDKEISDAREQLEQLLELFDVQW